MTTYPTNLDALVNPNSTDDTATVDHAAQHSNANDAIEAIQGKVGVDSSAVVTSIDYLLKNTASVDPGHKHSMSSLSEVNITSPTDGQALTYDNASSKWVNTATSVANASTTTAGVVEIATTADIDAATGTGGTGAILGVSPDNLNSSIYKTQLPSATEKAALVGTSGTAVSGSNKLVDDGDTSATSSAGKVLRQTAGGVTDNTVAVDYLPVFVASDNLAMRATLTSEGWNGVDDTVTATSSIKYVRSIFRVLGSGVVRVSVESYLDGGGSSDSEIEISGDITSGGTAVTAPNGSIPTTTTFDITLTNNGSNYIQVLSWRNSGNDLVINSVKVSADISSYSATTTAAKYFS